MKVKQTEAKQTTLTDLEERLAGAEGSDLRLQLMCELSDIELQLSSRLAGMVPKSEFPVLSACLNAARVAQVVLHEWVPGTAQISGRAR